MDAMLAKGMAVQIDIHPEERLQAAGEDTATKAWSASRCCGAGWPRTMPIAIPEMIFFEIMNEPEVRDPYRWAGVQAAAAAAIREVAPKNTIIATGPNWSGDRRSAHAASAARRQRDLHLPFLRAA